MMKYSDSPNAYINAKDLEIAIVKATSYGDALDAVREAPSIDIVHCSECKHENSCEHQVLLSTMWNEVEDTADIEYCSYGEREGER